MTETLTHPNAFAVWFKDLDRWSVSSFFRIGWGWPASMIRPLSDGLERKSVAVDRASCQLGQLQLVTLHFDGEMEPRDMQGKEDFKGKLFFAQSGEVIYSKIDVRNGAIGVVPPNLPKVAVSSEYPVYRVRPAVALPDYVKLLFRTSAFRQQINSMISGASGRKRVQPDDLEKVKVPFPPVPVQEVVVAHWRAAQDAVEKSRKAIAQLEAHIRLEIYNALGMTPPSTDRPSPKVFSLMWKDIERWSVGFNQQVLQKPDPREGKFRTDELGKLILDLENGWSPKCHNRPAEQDEWGVLKLGAVSFGVFDPQENKALPKTLKCDPRLEIKPGEVLISRANITRLVGACALVTEVRPRLLLCDKIFRVVFKSESPVLPGYLVEIMKTPHLRHQIEAAVTGTSPTMKNITKTSLLQLLLPVPPWDIQNAIVDMANRHRRRIVEERSAAEERQAQATREVEEMILGIRPIG